MIAISEKPTGNLKWCFGQQRLQVIRHKNPGFFDKMMTTPPGGEHLISNAGAGKEVRKLITKIHKAISEYFRLKRHVFVSWLFHRCFKEIFEDSSMFNQGISNSKKVHLISCAWLDMIPTSNGRPPRKCLSVALNRNPDLSGACNT